MKKNTVLYMASAALLCLASCVKESSLDDVKTENETQPLTIYASASGVVLDAPSSAPTKTQLSSGSATSIVWNKTDELSVFTTTGTNVRFATTEAYDLQTDAAFTESTPGEFTGSTDGVYAVYPYNATATVSGSVITTDIPQIQPYSSQNFVAGSNVAVACMEGGSLEFKNVCGYIRIAPSTANVTSLTIKGNNGEILAGRVRINYNGGTPAWEAVEGEGLTSVTVTRGTVAMAKNTAFYVAILPQTFSKGITIEFTTDGGLAGYTVGSHVFHITGHAKSSASLTIERNTTTRVSYSTAWDTGKIGAQESALMIDAESGTVGEAVATTLGITDFLGVIGDVVFECEKELWEVAANPAADAVNGSSKVIKCNPPASPYGVSDVENARLQVNLSDGKSTNKANLKKYEKHFNSIKFKVYLASVPADITDCPRIQWFSSSLLTPSGESIPKPMVTPSYVNGTKMDVKTLTYSATNTEANASLKGDYNVIDDAWKAAYKTALKAGWNELIFNIGDIRDNKNSPSYEQSWAVAGDGRLPDNGLAKFRIYPCFPVSTTNSVAYHPDSYSVTYIDDVELLYYR